MPSDMQSASRSEEFLDAFTGPGGVPAVPILLGVVGHRDIKEGDRERLKGKLVDLFRQFRLAYPHTPLLVVSSLAQGADQIAADAALDAGVFVRAPLPMPQEAYRASTSFDRVEAQEHLDTLLADPRVDSYVVPLPERKPGEPEPDWMRLATSREEGPDKTLRQQCYANAGGHLVRRCHALVALWDGPSGLHDGPSGTAEFVRFKLQGIPPKQFPWTDAEPLGFAGDRGLVFGIFAPRNNPNPNPLKTADPHPGERDREPGELRLYVPGLSDDFRSEPFKSLDLIQKIGPWNRFWGSIFAHLGRKAEHGKGKETAIFEAEIQQFCDLCTTLDTFNADLKQPSVVADLREKRLKEPEKKGVDGFDESHNRWLLRLTQIREAAAALTSTLQPRLDRALLIVFVLLGLSALSFHFYAHWGEEGERHGWLLVVSTTLLLATTAVVLTHWYLRLEPRRLDSRALAEALRVRRTWAMAGIGRSVADSYLSQLRGEVSWVRQALLHVCPPPRVWVDQFEKLDQAKQLEILKRVREEWIVSEKTGQIPQYARAEHKMQAASRRWQRRGIWLAVLGWFGLAILWVVAPLPGIRERFEHLGGTLADPNPTYITIASALVIFGGLCIAYCERCAYEDLAKQYERMRIVFRNGDRELVSRLEQSDVKGAQNVISALGVEAIIENSQWLILRRARPLEVHIGA